MLEKEEPAPWRDDCWCPNVLSSLLDNSTISHDVTFKTSDGGSVSAHRVIVAAGSPVFRAMLYGGTRESSQTEIELPTIDSEMLKLVFKFMYTGEVNPDSDKNLHLLQAAHYFNVEILEIMTSNIIAESLDIHNYCKIVTVAVEKQFQHLWHRCFHFIEDHITEIICGKEFTDLPYMALKDIMSSPELEVRELDLFFAVVEWSKQQKANLPEEEIKEIFRLIRYPLIQVDDLLDKVRPTNMADPDLYKAALEYHLVPKKFTGPDEQIQSRRFYFDFSGPADMKVTQSPKGTEIMQICGYDSQMCCVNTIINVTEKKPVLFKFCLKRSQADSHIMFNGVYRNDSVRPGENKSFQMLLHDMPKGEVVNGSLTITGSELLVKVGMKVAAIEVGGDELIIGVWTRKHGDQVEFTRI